MFTQGVEEGWNFRKDGTFQGWGRSKYIILPWISRGTSYDSVAAAVNLDDAGGDGAAVWVLIVLVSWYMEREEIFHRYWRLFKKWTEKKHERYPNAVSGKGDFSQNDWGVGVGIGEFFCLTPDGVDLKSPKKDNRTTEVGWVGQVHYLSHLSLFSYRNHPWQFTVLWLVENWNVWRFETGSRTSDIRDGSCIMSTNN